MINSSSGKVAISLVVLAFFLIVFNIGSTAQVNYWEHAKTNIKKYDPPRKDLVIIIDYTKSILVERLYILDVNTGKVILSSTVAHAWKSGLLFPKKFSNTLNSELSSNGNYLTGNQIISPKFGIAMLVKGLDKGINDNARIREIIFHSLKKIRINWSDGCFATPEEDNKKIIELTKNGVLVCVIS